MIHYKSPYTQDIPFYIQDGTKKSGANLHKEILAKTCSYILTKKFREILTVVTVNFFLQEK